MERTGNNTKGEISISPHSNIFVESVLIEINTTVFKVRKSILRKKEQFQEGPKWSKPEPLLLKKKNTIWVQEVQCMEKRRKNPSVLTSKMQEYEITD